MNSKTFLPLNPVTWRSGAIALLGAAAVQSAEPVALSSQEELAEHLVGQAYPQLRGVLEKDAAALVAQLAEGGEIDLEDPDTRSRLLLLAVLDRLPVEKLAERASTPGGGEFLTWLFTRPERLEILLAEIRPEDRPDQVLEVWQQLWAHEEDAERRDRYANLALALALIYDNDSAKPRANDQAYYPTPELIERYEWFRDRSEAGRLTVSCAKQSVRSLLRVVDTNVSIEELEWVHRHVSGSRSKAGNQYSDIEYLMERAVDGYNPYESYTLSEIEKHGGICADQAHYSANAAKARGIPASVVAGTGDRGPHAWLGFMPEPDEWARYGDQGITNGYLRCSQRAARISERLLWMESERDYEVEHRVPALLDLQLAAAAVDADRFGVARQRLAHARAKAGLNVELWKAEEGLLLASGAGAEEWKEFVTRIEREFDDYPDQLEWALTLKIRHVVSSLPEEEIVDLVERELRRVARKVGSQGSALVNTIGHIGELIAASGAEDSGDALRSFYRTCFRRYGEEDLEVFTLLVDRFAKTGGNLSPIREQVADDLVTFYKRYAESNSKEYFRADMELSILRKITKAYERLAPEQLDEIEDLREDIRKRDERISRAAR